MKKCNRCGETKTLDQYHKHADTKDGLKGNCKECDSAYDRARYVANRESILESRREYYATNGERVRAGNRASTARNPRGRRNKQLLWAFGITLDGYETMLARQGGVCGLCERAETEIHPLSKKVRNYAVDHDHATGEIRGLLCNDCNRGLGLLGDTAERLRKAVAYIERAAPQGDPN